MPTVGDDPTAVGPLGAGVPPSGGTTGQALTRLQAHGPLAWADLPGVVPGFTYVSGEWYDNRATADRPSGNSTVPVGAATFMPLWLPQPLTIKTLAVNVPTVVAGAALQIAALSMTATGQPGTVNYAYGRALSVAGPLAGDLSVAPLTLPAGWSYLAVGNYGTGSCAVSGVQAPSVRQIGGLSTIASTSDNLGWRITSGFTGFTSNPTPAAYQVTSAVPVIWFQLA